MTDDERKQVVELLRRAVDIGICAAACVIYGEESIIGAALADAAIAARFAVDAEAVSYQETCRIAAQRVEEGSWP